MGGCSSTVEQSCLCEDQRAATVPAEIMRILLRWGIECLPWLSFDGEPGRWTTARMPDARASWTSTKSRSSTRAGNGSCACWPEHECLVLVEMEVLFGELEHHSKGHEKRHSNFKCDTEMLNPAIRI